MTPNQICREFNILLQTYPIFLHEQFQKQYKNYWNRSFGMRILVFRPDAYNIDLDKLYPYKFVEMV